VRDVLKAYFDKKTRESESQVAKLRPFAEPSILAVPHAIAALSLAFPEDLSQ
jgi:hypothetical protein